MPTEKVDASVTFEKFCALMNVYVMKTKDFGNDMSIVFTDLIDPTADFAKNMPDEPTDDDKKSIVKTQILAAEVEQYVLRKFKLQENIHSACSIIINQCSSGLQSVLKGLAEYDAKHKHDIVWLLQSIKKSCAGVDASTPACKHPPRCDRNQRLLSCTF